MYINNKDLFNEIVKCQENGIFSEELGKMVMSIAYNYADKGNFAGYTYKDDMIGDAILTICSYLMSSFNPTKTTNAFAYVTKICENAFLNHLRKQKKHSDIKDALYQRLQENTL